jgi:hypothetical protein
VKQITYLYIGAGAGRGIKLVRSRLLVAAVDHEEEIWLEVKI